ncbi:hypothetical protein QBC47DRAFT_438125 [Echria macrotheca]|uniref:MARVEL domain-containing protein n=1 Tax=Echria macrotheca TaxID=438768 RepID=A0AAJ0BKZ7_9PEZI|nr:hypothetical protein QBC47DRAFT_438125 [Echria macrotheca]
MEEVKPIPAAYAAPVGNNNNTNHNQYIQQTPTWVVIVRGLQIFFALIILGLCAYLIHGKAMDANVFALVVCLMTWVVSAYSLLSEKIPGLHSLYQIWAVLSLDLLMAIFWLSSLGANAAQRASFKYDVDVSYCYNDGSAVNSNYCVVRKRDLARRAAVAGPAGLACMSAIAGLSALMMLLFVATLVFHGRTFHVYHLSTKPAVAAVATDNGKIEMNPHQYQYQQQQPVQGAYAAAAPAPQQYPPQQGYPVQQPPQGQAGPYQLAGSQPQPPAQGYAAGGQYPDPSQGQYQQPHMYSPQGSPAPGQPYQPPQH